MKRILLFAVIGLFAFHATAEETETLEVQTDSAATLNETPKASLLSGTTLSELAKKFDPTIKFGGYIISQATVTDQKEANHSNFNLRLVRLYLNGYCFNNVYYRLQMEMNGQPGEDKGPRIVDAFIEWQPLDEIRIKTGQFKRSFGFENPTAPLLVGHGSFSQATTKFLFNDRNGAHSTGGRDVGVQVQGDFLPAADGHKWLHYQVGLFNGQGINHSDKDNFKDLIGGIWISPVKDLRIGGFGWNGKYTNEKYDATSAVQLQSVKRVRWGVGVDYESDWVCRAEYIHSVGGVVTNKNLSDRADAWYATVGVPVRKDLKIYAKWDCYRDAKAWSNLKQNYVLTANWWVGKNFLVQANYTFADDRSYAADRYYNTVDLQIAARF